MSNVGRPRTKLTTDIVAYQRVYQRDYQRVRRARQQAAKLKAARITVKTSFTISDVQWCPPEKMERLFRKLCT